MMIFYKVLLFTTIIGIVTSYGKLQKNKDFQYQMDVEEIGITYKEDSPMKMDIHRIKYNRTANPYIVNITITDIIDYRYRFKFELQVWGTGGWKENVLRYENRDPCKHGVILLGRDFQKLMDNIGIGKCPWKPGYYEYKEEIIIRDVPVNMYFGRVRYIGQLFRKGRREVVLTVVHTGTVNEVIEA